MHATGDEGRARAEAAGAAHALPASQLPWNQLPTFEPGVTDVQVYARKLQFLRDIWPEEHLPLLAPRAALMIEGVAFQKVARLDAAKLRTPSGVQYLVEALGGQWGKMETEEKFHLFERALYMTSQRPDELNDSYLARHDVAFEDLMSRKVSLEDIRAYVLLRQSQLSGEDKKKIIVESQGDLKYDTVRRSFRLLGSRFFQELQGVPKGQSRTKAYDINMMDHGDEGNQVFEAETWDEDSILQTLYEAGDEDAVFIADFEDTIVETLQESQELASCYTTYLEARTRLREKARGRGFWPISGGSGGKGKKGKGARGKGKGGFYQKPKTLAEKIATSECRRCFQMGHWKRECPLNKTDGKNKNPGETISLAEALSLDEIVDKNGPSQELLQSLPADAERLGLGLYRNNFESVSASRSVEMFETCQEHTVGPDEVLLTDCSDSVREGFRNHLSKALSNCCRKHGYSKPAPAVKSTLTNRPESQVFEIAPDVAFLNFEEQPSEAVIDTGASRTVIGLERVQNMLNTLDDEIRDSVRKVSSSVQFRFGNSGTLQSLFALCLPRCKNGWIRVEVVPGQTPFLISNSVLRELGVLIDPRNQVLRFLEHDTIITLNRCRKNLLCVNIQDMLSIHSGEGNHDEEIYHTRGNDQVSQDTSRISPHACSTQVSTVVQKPAHYTQPPQTEQGDDPAATPSDQTSEQIERSISRADHGTRSVSPERTLGRGGSRVDHSQQNIYSSPQYPEVSSTTRNQELVRVGSNSHSIGKTFREDILRDIPTRSGVYLSNSKSESSVLVASQSAELCDCHVQVPASAQDNTAADHELRICITEPTGNGPAANHADGQQDEVNQSASGPDGADQGLHRNSILVGCDSSDQDSGPHELQGGEADSIAARASRADADRHQSDQDPSTADTDRSTPTGACEGDTSAQDGLLDEETKEISEPQVQVLQNKIQH